MNIGTAAVAAITLVLAFPALAEPGNGRGNGQADRDRGSSNREAAHATRDARASAREARDTTSVAARDDRAGPGRSGDLTYGRIISSLRNGSTSDPATAVADATDLGVVLLSSVPGQGWSNARALDNALAAGADDADALRDELLSRPAFAAGLEAAGYEIDRIVGYTLDSSGRLILILDDRG